MSAYPTIPLHLHNSFLGEFALLFLYTTYAAASNAWNAINTKMASHKLGADVVTTT